MMDVPRRSKPRRRHHLAFIGGGAVLAILLAVMTGISRGALQGDAAAGTAWTTPATTPVAPAPPTVGLDSARMAAALEQAIELPRLRTLIVARHGEVLAEQHVNGPGPHEPVNVKSVSKSILSALVGLAIEDGYVEGVDQPVLPFFHGHVVDDDPRRARITVGHLLSMQSGLERTSGNMYGAWVSSPNWVRYAISRPMVAEPGGQRLYSTGNSHLLSAVLTQATGRSTWDYARERLAEPLGIRLPRWPTDPQGIFFGGNDMRISPRDLLRFGELYRNGGRFDGEQIVPEEWVRASLEPRANSRWSGDGYGFGWFATRVRGHRVFYGMGYGGQFLFIVPELELTVVVTSDPNVVRDRNHNRAVRRLLADWIIPAAEVGASATN